MGAQRSLPTSPVLTRGLLKKMWTSAWVLGRQAAGSCNIRLQEDVVKHLGAWQRAPPAWPHASDRCASRAKQHPGPLKSQLPL